MPSHQTSALMAEEAATRDRGGVAAHEHVGIEEAKHGSFGKYRAPSVKTIVLRAAPFSARSEPAAGDPPLVTRIWRVSPLQLRLGCLAASNSPVYASTAGRGALQGTGETHHQEGTPNDNRTL